LFSDIYRQSESDSVKNEDNITDTVFRSIQPVQRVPSSWQQWHIGSN